MWCLYSELITRKDKLCSLNHPDLKCQNQVLAHFWAYYKQKITVSQNHAITCSTQDRSVYLEKSIAFVFIQGKWTGILDKNNNGTNVVWELWEIFWCRYKMFPKVLLLKAPSLAGGNIERWLGHEAVNLISDGLVQSWIGYEEVKPIWGSRFGEHTLPLVPFSGSLLPDSPEVSSFLPLCTSMGLKAM